MSELLLPGVFERLQLCADEVRERADNLEDLHEIRKMARTTVAGIAPELRMWRGSSLELVTDMAFYTLLEGAACDGKLDGDIFEMRGIFVGGTLREHIEELDMNSAISDIELCLRFQPEIAAEEPDLVLAESVLVPVVALKELSKVS